MVKIRRVLEVFSCVIDVMQICNFVSGLLPEKLFDLSQKLRASRCSGICAAIRPISRCLIRKFLLCKLRNVFFICFDDPFYNFAFFLSVLLKFYPFVGRESLPVQPNVEKNQVTQKPTNYHIQAHRDPQQAHERLVKFSAVSF
jgi:hypothetical protein